jgi:hypothetical protein
MPKYLSAENLKPRSRLWFYKLVNNESGNF